MVRIGTPKVQGHEFLNDIVISAVIDIDYH